LRDATDSDSFTTMLYVTIRSDSGEVSLINMGHPAPLILRSETADRARSFFVEGARNRAVGWFEDPGYEATELRLEPGDRLVLFTDGFLESKSSDGEVFGEHRLAEALERFASVTSAAIPDEIVREVESFAAGKLDDDLTMLVIEFEGASRRGPGLAPENGDR
jgi:sigma-B regulation protein RsbU (phosphoserine phosphatase)